MIVIQLLLFFCSVFYLRKRSYVFTNFMALILAIFFVILLSFRSFNIPDTYSYYEFFSHPYRYDGFVESSFLKLCSIFRFTSFRTFLLIISGITMLFWFISTKKILSQSYFIIPLCSFISYMGAYYMGITLRVSIAVTFILFGLSLSFTKKKSFLFYYILNIIAISFHNTMILCLLFPLLNLVKISNKKLYLILIIGVGLHFINLVPSLISLLSLTISNLNFTRFSAYLSRDGNLEVTQLSFTFIKHLIFSFLFIYHRLDVEKYCIGINSSKYNMLLNSYVLGTIMYLLFSFMYGGARLAMVFLFFEFLLISFIVLYSKSYPKIYRVSFLIITSTINLFALYSKIPELLIYV